MLPAIPGLDIRQQVLPSVSRATSRVGVLLANLYQVWEVIFTPLTDITAGRTFQCIQGQSIAAIYNVAKL